MSATRNFLFVNRRFILKGSIEVPDLDKKEGCMRSQHSNITAGTHPAMHSTVITNMAFAHLNGVFCYKTLRSGSQEPVIVVIVLSGAARICELPVPAGGAFPAERRCLMALVDNAFAELPQIDPRLCHYVYARDGSSMEIGVPVFTGAEVRQVRCLHNGCLRRELDAARRRGDPEAAAGIESKIARICAMSQKHPHLRALSEALRSGARQIDLAMPASQLIRSEKIFGRVV